MAQLEQSSVGYALQRIPLPGNPILSSGVTLIIHERSTKAILVLIVVFVR
jgi:hypothetical protein